MNEAQAMDVAREAIWTLILVSSPLMLIGLGVGLIIAILQALTQVQEATLTFVPKIIVIFLSMLVLIPFMLHKMQDLTRFLMDKIVAIG